MVGNTKAKEKTQKGFDTMRRSQKRQLMLGAVGLLFLFAIFGKHHGSVNDDVAHSEDDVPAAVQRQAHADLPKPRGRRVVHGGNEDEEIAAKRKRIKVAKDSEERARAEKKRAANEEAALAGLWRIN